MRQSTACLHCAWRTTSLHVGGRAARRSCRPGLSRGGGGRQAGATVSSWRCELTLTVAPMLRSRPFLRGLRRVSVGRGEGSPAARRSGSRAVVRCVRQRVPAGRPRQTRPRPVRTRRWTAQIALTRNQRFHFDVVMACANAIDRRRQPTLSVCRRYSVIVERRTFAPPPTRISPSSRTSVSAVPNSNNPNESASNLVPRLST